jgi:hypothetical protein
MPGRDGEGANIRMTITQIRPPVFDGDPKKLQITKESAISLDAGRIDQAMKLKVAVLIQRHQRVLSLELRSESGPLPVNPEADGGPVAQDARDAFGAPADHHWAGFFVDWEPRHGTHVHSRFKLDGFNVPPRGFQVVVVVITAANLSFRSDHYFVGTSVLPGKDAVPTQLKLS